MQSYDYSRREGIETISWDRFMGLCHTLAAALAGRRVDTVVGVARAGFLAHRGPVAGA